MKTINHFCLILILAALSSRAYPQDKDNMTLEQARAKFTDVDAKLSDTYNGVIAGLNAEKAAQLKKDEDNWLLYREDLSLAFPKFNTGIQPDEPKNTSDYWSLKEALTEDRIKFLKAWTGKSVPPGITGSYDDSYNGSLDLEETASGIKFQLIANRGAYHHVGVITGIAKRNGDEMYFKEDIDPTLGDPPCELIFKFIEGHIVRVVQKTADPDAEKGVSYSGDYYKSGKLKQPIQPIP